MLGLANPHATFYERRRNGNYIPYGDYVQLPYSGYGNMGLTAPHATFYSRRRNARWVPYGDFVYRPVTDDGEVVPLTEVEAYGGYGLTNTHATFYERQRDNRWIPYGQVSGGSLVPIALAGVIGYLIWKRAA